MNHSEKPIGSRIRSFLEQLFTSRHVRFLEAELVRQRMHYEAVIRELKEAGAALNQKIEKYELAMNPALLKFQPKSPPPSTADYFRGWESGSTSFSQALEEHNRKQEQEEVNAG